MIFVSAFYNSQNLIYKTYREGNAKDLQNYQGKSQNRLTNVLIIPNHEIILRYNILSSTDNTEYEVVPYYEIIDSEPSPKSIKFNLYDKLNNQTYRASLSNDLKTFVLAKCKGFLEDCEDIVVVYY